MSKCHKLWNIWLITYIVVINIYLTVVSIKDYLDFKYQILDLAYGGNWDMSTIYVILCCINVSLGLLPIIIYMSVVHQGNLANDGYVLGRDPDVFNLTIDECGRGKIVPSNTKKSSFCTNPIFQLIYMELPPLSCFLHVISAISFLIPRSIIDGHRIHHGVLKSNRIWHSDLDFIFYPDQQHNDFVFDQNDIYIQPVSVAYFNFCVSLISLSLHYSRVMWHVSRKFTLLFSFVLILWTVHFLVEYCSVSVIIKISLNPQIVSEHLQLSVNAFTVLFLFIGSNIILLFSFTAVFHYGMLQYADVVLHKNHKSRRQLQSSSPQIMVGSNHLDIPGAFSPSISENNYSESPVEPLYSRNNLPHVVAIVCLFASTSLKSVYDYLSFVHLYYTTSDYLTLLNVLISCLFVFFWLITWFALALRRTWNFKIKSEAKFAAEPLYLESAVPDRSGTMQLHQLHNSLIRNTRSSDMNLSKQDMRMLNRNVGLDGGSDDTDMSSKLSSNNYVFLQSMRNGQMGLLDAYGQPSMLRNPLLVPSNLNNQGLPNNNIFYANDDSMHNRSVQLDDQLGSEHSFNSNRSRNMGFEHMPPILPNFDENRYKILNPNSVAMEKLIPKYLRNPSLDYNGTVHFSMPNNNESMVHTMSPATLSYAYDTSLHNITKYKQSMVNNQVRPPTTDKYATIPSIKSDYDCNQYPDDDKQRRGLQYSEEGGLGKMVFDARRVGKSPIMFPTVEETNSDSVLTESQCLLPTYNGNSGDNNSDNNNNGSGNNPQTGFLNNNYRKSLQSSESNNNNSESDAVADRMCSQV